MKKIYCVIIFFFAFMMHSFAQNLAIGIHTGAPIYIGSGNSVTVPVGINIEWAYNSEHSISGRADIGFGTRPQDPNTYYISPEYKYYIVGETLDGFYIGGYFGMGGRILGSAYFTVGGLTGYSYMFKEKFNLEANVQFGYGKFPLAGQHVFHLSPTIGVRYSF